MRARRRFSFERRDDDRTLLEILEGETLPDPPLVGSRFRDIVALWCPACGARIETIASRDRSQ
jgi:hypothetical protein